MKTILLRKNKQLANIFPEIFSIFTIKHTRIQSLQQRLRVAIEHLENNSLETRVTVINDLEEITKEHPQYHWIIMGILTNFVRESSPNKPHEEVNKQTSAQIGKDIQAALTIISKRDINKDPKNEQLDLSHTDMRGANLQGGNLEKINLYQANLAEANLEKANLEGVILSAANLESANLQRANLKGAILSAANLKGANLSGANLHQANLYLARLHGANLNDAILKDANLREANFCG